MYMNKWFVANNWSSVNLPEATSKKSFSTPSTINSKKIFSTDWDLGIGYPISEF